MNRRQTLFAFAALAMMAFSVAPARADRADDMVEWLADQGFESIEVTRTLLGRVRILVTLEDGFRELIVNPRTGEILRDVWIAADGTVIPYQSLAYLDDDDDDDDHSGPGGGSGSNSGPGGGGSGNSGPGGGDDHDDKSGPGGGDD